MVAVAQPQVRLRAMCPADLGTVSAMEIASYEFPWSIGVFGDCLRAGHSCWVLSVDTVTAGYGVLSVGAGEAHVLNVCIDPAWRSRGLGRHLLQRLLGIARWHRAERVFLEVRPSNPRAIALYASLGFHEIGRRRGYYPARDGREDAIVMALTMAAQDGSSRLP